MNRLRHAAYLAMLALLILLPGCSLFCPVPDEKPREPVQVPVTAEVGVREKCVVVLPDEPKWQVGVTTSTEPLERSKAVLAELEQRRDWENKVKAAVKKCE